jgi:hypothetical protein
VPLRRGPNESAAIIAAILARWRHVLSFVNFIALNAIWENARSVLLLPNAVNPYSVAGCIKMRRHGWNMRRHGRT